MKRGALARVVEDTVNLTSSGPEQMYQAVPKGSEFTVEDYVSDAEAEDGVGFYWGSWRGGANNLAVVGHKVEQAKSAEEMRARRIPSRQELLEMLVADLTVSTEELRVEEIDKPQNGVTEIYGRTADGLPFGARIRVEQVWRADD